MIPAVDAAEPAEHIAYGLSVIGAVRKDIQIADQDRNTDDAAQKKHHGAQFFHVKVFIIDEIYGGIRQH